MKRAGLAAFLTLAILGPKAHAYPDMIRHRYVNCNACHVSPTGGGLLNPYGRSLSKELLSSFGKDGEEKLFHGFLPKDLPDWLLAGGDVRVIQVHQETPERKTGRGFLMQANFSLGVDAGKLKAVAVLGEADPKTNKVKMAANRYYALWNPQDELSIRAGRFVPVFGINVPYHTLPTRSSLGFGPGFERHTLESVWSGEAWSFGASASRSAGEKLAAAQRESLLTAQVSRTLGSSHKLGLSYAAGFDSASERRVYGLHALLGFSEKWAYLTEFDLQRQETYGARAQSGLYHFSQLIFEPWKGVSFYFLEDYEKTDLQSTESLSNSLGPGFRLFPRPHFELDFVFLKTRTALVADRYDDLAWLVAHYYF